jgi:hypothetical protein
MTSTDISRAYLIFLALFRHINTPIDPIFPWLPLFQKNMPGSVQVIEKCHPEPTDAEFSDDEMMMDLEFGQERPQRGSLCHFHSFLCEPP